MVDWGGCHRVERRGIAAGAFNEDLCCEGSRHNELLGALTKCVGAILVRYRVLGVTQEHSEVLPGRQVETRRLAAFPRYQLQ